MSRNLSARDLLEGAMYAMEQAGHLLHDAVDLFERGRYSSAVVLSVFAREEMGRAEIFLEKRKEALASSGWVSADSVQKACDDHVTKLRQGQAGISVRWGPEHRETREGLDADHESEAYKKARALVDDVVKRKRHRDPEDTHQKRLRALYVEPTDTGWNRPCETARENARQLLGDVANDYSVNRGALFEKPDDEALAKATAEWKDRPKFPDRIWPPHR